MTWERMRDIKDIRLLLFDLDDTLLRRDKSISERNLAALERCRLAGIAVGVSTSRSERNAGMFLEHVKPDVCITSAGASVRVGRERIFSAAFTTGETKRIISTARELCGLDVPMDADTADTHYRNYPLTEEDIRTGWAGSVRTDFSQVPEDALMVCVNMPKPGDAERLRAALPFCGVVKFAYGDWYKVTRAGITKASGVETLCEALGIHESNIAAFGDDLADIEMLRLAGLGVAMGNALPEVKAHADIVIGDNDSDAIAEFLDKMLGENDGSAGDSKHGPNAYYGQ